MAKYSKFERKTPEARYKIHPAWTGIGCLMLVLVPIIAGTGALELVKLGKSQHWPFMSELSGNLTLPDIFYNLPVISIVANFLSSIHDFPAVASFFLIIVLLLSGILSFGYALIYRMIGPPRYTSLDEPAPRVNVRKTRR
jgi:hypothetical protein